MTRAKLLCKAIFAFMNRAAAAAAAESCIRRWYVPELAPRVKLVQGPASLVGSSSLYVRLYNRAHAHERHILGCRDVAVSHTNRVACFRPRRCALHRLDGSDDYSDRRRQDQRQAAVRLQCLAAAGRVGAWSGWSTFVLRAGLASTNSTLACCTACAPPLHFALRTLVSCSGECALMEPLLQLVRRATVMTASSCLARWQETVHYVRRELGMTP